MGGWFHGIGVGTRYVRIVDRFEDFVTDQGIPHTDLEVQTIAHRSMQRHVSLFDGKVGITGHHRRVGAKGSRIRASQDADLVARAPLVGSVYGLFKVQFDDVEVETISLARAVPGIAWHVCIPDRKSTRLNSS